MDKKLETKISWTILIILIVVLFYYIVSAYNSKPDYIHPARAEAEMRNIATALETYYVDNCSYPSCNG